LDRLVSTEWLAGEAGAADLRIVDASYGPATAAADHAAGHIPGAVFLDLETLVDAASPLPNMLPDAETFAARMRALGLDRGSRIVLYEDAPWKTAARAWWMLHLFGAHDVAILDGGLAKWKAEGRPLEKGMHAASPGAFAAAGQRAGVRSLAQMQANLASGAAQVLDARSAARFTGAEPDPRPGTAAGHIPGSRNLPYGALFYPDGTWKRGDDLRAAFAAAGIDLGRPLITTCGSGITAAVLLFGATLLGAREVGLYDGSWSEWGADASTPKATGLA